MIRPGKLSTTPWRLDSGAIFAQDDPAALMQVCRGGRKPEEALANMLAASCAGEALELLQDIAEYWHGLNMLTPAAEKLLRRIGATVRKSRGV
jgi:hypothetical protein